jgi:hypothetical protein
MLSRGWSTGTRIARTRLSGLPHATNVAANSYADRLARNCAIAALRTGRSAASQLSGMEATANRSLPLSYAVQFGSRARVRIASCVSGPKNGPGPADAVGFPDGPSAPEA